jgi:hypothetical protein
MSKTLSMVVAAIIAFAGLTMTISAMAADTNIATGRRVAMSSGYCQDLWRCGPGGCNWHRVCTRPCPDEFSCAPLYGAYGPYGGVGYWGGYTDVGWAYQR